MKQLTAVLLMLCGGVAFAAPPAPLSAPKECARVASFAQSIATLRASGIPEDQLEDYVSAPTVQTFPITLIRHRVYAEAMEPQVAYSTFNSICLAIGYASIVQYMTAEDEMVRTKEENARLRSWVAVQHQQINELQDRVSRLPICPVETNR